MQWGRSSVLLNKASPCRGEMKGPRWQRAAGGAGGAVWLHHHSPDPTKGPQPTAAVLHCRHCIHADTLFVHKLQKNLLTRRRNHIRSLLNHPKKKRKRKTKENKRKKRAQSLSTPTTLPKSSAFYDLIVSPQE